MSAQITEVLQGTLSSDPNIRIKSELTLAESFTNPDTALSLASLIVSQDSDTYFRLNDYSSCVVLRKYVLERWSPYFPGFKGNAPPVELKGTIRQTVFNALSDPNRKIRTSAAHILSSIANCDWPDEYPDLLNSLISLLSSTSGDSVHGAMRVFTEFIKSDLTEDQILPVLRQLLPVLLNILGSNNHSPLTRARAVAVFQQCVSALFMVKEEHSQAVKEATARVLPVWLEAFKVLLNMDPRQDVQSDTWDGLAIRIQIFKTLDTINTSFPKALAPYVPELLATSLTHLQALQSFWAQYYVSSSPSPVPSNSEDEPLELYELGCPILDFISSIVRSCKAKSWLTPENLKALIASILSWVQMTNDDEENWGTDANAFVAQEEDETQAYSLRMAGLDLMSTLLDREQTATIEALVQITSYVVPESSQLRSSGSQDWWRPLEAALVSLGSVAETVVDDLDDDEPPSPAVTEVRSLLANIVPSLLTLSECPFLQGRSFVFASQYSELLPGELAGQYLDAAVQVVEASDAGIPIKVSAIKALSNFSSRMDQSIVLPLAARIAKDLGPFLLMTSEDTLSLVLETLREILSVGRATWLEPELADSLALAIVQVWSANNRDPLFVSLLTDVLGALAAAPNAGVYARVADQSLPTLCTALASAKNDESWITSSALEMITVVVKDAAEGQFISDAMFSTILESCFKCMREGEDRDVLQNGVILLTRIVVKDHQRLTNWRDQHGQSGLDNVLSIIAKLLQNEDESGGLVIGDLITRLLRRADAAVIAVLPNLLQAMVSRMATAKTATFVQSLVVPFALLVRTERDTVLSLLEQTNVNGRTGLDVLIQTWCENAETFQGFWATRVSTLGLTQLLTAERPSLQNLAVKGDIIVKPETQDVIVTRSRAKKTPHEFTSIPFPVKALKIIIHDLQSSGEVGVMSTQGAAEDADDDDGDDEWADEENLYQGMKNDELAFLSDLIGPRGVAFDNDDVLEQSDDDDLKDDPVTKMDIKAHLVSFLQDCARANVNNFGQLVDQLNVEEMAVLKRIVST